MSTKEKSEITLLLIEARNGRTDAYDQLFSLVYNELKRIAKIQLAREYSAHTLQRTELVHEVYLKLVNQTGINWQDRSHFFAIAAKCMRQILVNHARRKKAKKRGGDRIRIPLDEDRIHVEKHAGQIVKVDELLNEMEKLDERMFQIVELRFFGGFTIEATAELLEISVSTVDRDWQKARGLLYQRMKSPGS